MRVLIAGGGTGGHLFPGMAMAEAFKSKMPDSRVLFVGTRNPLEMSTLSRRGFEHVAISVEGLKGRGLWRQVRSAAKLPGAVGQAWRILRRFRPDVVIGVGGYASGPVTLAARLMGRKVALHEQNAVPGMANRMAARFAHRIFVSFPEVPRAFADAKTVVTGNPVRQAFLVRPPERQGRELFTVAVVGGSQGAHAINQAVTEALDGLTDSRRFTFIHQTGAMDEEWVRRAYEMRGVKAVVQAFFEDMAAVYHSADLVICRAGATTVAELTALGKPAVFVPFPFAANNHQELNARYVARAGGGEVILQQDLAPSALAGRIEYYASNPQVLEEMARRSASLGRVEASELIVEECRRMVKG